MLVIISSFLYLASLSSKKGTLFIDTVLHLTGGGVFIVLCLFAGGGEL